MGFGGEVELGVRRVYKPYPSGWTLFLGTQTCEIQYPSSSNERDADIVIMIPLAVIMRSSWVYLAPFRTALGARLSFCFLQYRRVP